MPEEGRNLTADDAWCDNESRFVSTDDSTKKKKRHCQVCLGASPPHESSLHLPVGPLSSHHRQDPRSRAQLWQGKQQGLVHRCVSQPAPQPLLPSACFPSHPDCTLRQQSPTFLAPEIVFMEDSFSTDGQGDGGGEGRMVWGWFKSIPFLVHFISMIIPSAPAQTIRHQIPEAGTPALTDGVMQSRTSSELPNITELVLCHLPVSPQMLMPSLFPLP